MTSEYQETTYSTLPITVSKPGSSKAEGTSAGALGRAWAVVKGWQIRMELVILAISICDTARIVVTPTLMLSKVQRAYEPPVDLNETDKFYNKKMVMWDQNYTYVNMPIAVLATIFFGAYSDKRGRKLPMILGLIGMFSGNMLYILCWWPSTDWPLQWLFLAAVLNGITGGFRMVTSQVNAYLSDQFRAKKTLSIRMIITYTILNIGDLIGSQMTKFISKRGGEILAAFIMQAINLVVLFYVVVFVKPVGAPNEVGRQSLLTITRDAFYSIYLSAKVVLRRREGRRRCLLLLAFLCGLLNRTAFSEEKALIGTYTKLKPFEWSTSDFAQYKSYRPFVQIVGLLFGLLVLKRIFNLRDTTILIMSTISMGVDSLLIGLATTSLFIYLSMGAGFMHALFNPLLYTLYSYLVEPDEAGRVYALDSIIHNVAYFFRTAGLQTLYINTVDWHQGFIWLVLSSMALISATTFVFIHVAVRKMGITE